MRRLLLACPLVVASLLGGCVKLQYQSLAPSARSFHEDPGVDEMYFGADAQFAVTDRRQQRYLLSTTLATQADTLDAWNPTVAWNETAIPAPPDIEQAATDEAPAAGDE